MLKAYKGNKFGALPSGPPPGDTPKQLGFRLSRPQRDRRGATQIINSFDQMYPDKPLKISGLPDANDMIENGLESTLKSLA